MSDRGSFITEFIYCDKCRRAAHDVLVIEDSHIWSQFIDSQPGTHRWIIAGKIKSGYPGGELIDMETKYGPMLEERICCPLRVAVIAESGEKIFTFKPENDNG